MDFTYIYNNTLMLLNNDNVAMSMFYYNCNELDLGMYYINEHCEQGQLYEYVYFLNGSYVEDIEMKELCFKQIKFDIMNNWSWVDLNYELGKLAHEQRHHTLAILLYGRNILYHDYTVINIFFEMLYEIKQYGIIIHWSDYIIKTYNPIPIIIYDYLDKINYKLTK